MANPNSPGGRSSKILRVEEIDALLDQELENPQAVLDTLVNAAAKGNHLPALFEKLHAVALAQDKVADLAFAYESLAQDRRLKLFPADAQATVFLHAVSFFADVFGDPDGAIVYAERALAAVPTHPDAIAKLERILVDKADDARLAKLYLDLAGHEREAEPQLAHLRLAAGYAARAPSLNELAIEALQKIMRLDPSDASARQELEERLTRSGKPREAVKLLEQILAREQPVSDVEAFQIRTRLLDLYAGELKEPHRAVPHIEALLAASPEHQGARQAAEALLDNRVVAARVAAALSDAYFKLGLAEQATAMLSFELKTVRGPRRLEVQRRLAFIKHDQGDPVGALELLGPVVSAEPGEDEARRRFVELSLSLNQPAEAAKLLTRALGSSKDPAIRARVNADVGTVYLRSGDIKRAEAAFQQVIEDGSDSSAMLLAARQLLELHEKSAEPKALASSLEIVARLETDPERRNAAARRLAKLAEGELADPPKAITAWRALIDSPWADEALRKLTSLFEDAGDWEGLVDVMERRALRAKDPNEARELAYRAAELRTTKGRDRAAALGAWRAHLARFGASRQVHAQMIPLLEQEKQWKELAWVVERELELAPLEDKVGLLNRLAQLRQARLDDVPGALAAYEQALAADAADKVSRAALEKLLGTGERETRLSAAQILERVLAHEEAGPGMLRVLETRAELAEDPAARLAALEAAIDVAGEKLRDPARALELASRALAHAVESSRADIPRWLERVEAFGLDAGKPAARAQALVRALGDHPVDGPEMLALGRTAAEALVSSSDVPGAIAIYRRALELEPGSPELLTRIDELLAEQGSPDERLQLYRTALARGPEGARRRELLHSMARLFAEQLDAPDQAIETYLQALAEDPKDAVAHQALVDLYAARRDFSALYAELERALALHEGERRNATLLRMAEVAAESGDVARALDHYRELLAAAELADHVLENIELLAHSNNDAETMRTVLERRIAVAGAPEDRAQLLEKLGLVQAKQLADADAASKSWLAGARFADQAGDDDRARRLYERVLGITPDVPEAARRLIELYAAEGAWQKVPEAFNAVMRGGVDERDLVALLLSLETPASEAGATDVFVVLSDAVLAKAGLETSRLRQVLLARARVLSATPNHRDEVAEIYRRVLELGGDEATQVADAFNLFLAGGELTAARIADRRWLFEWRAGRAADPTTVLIAWAVAEETTFGNPTASIELYKRVLDRDPERTDALHQLARLQTTHGDPEGALATLQTLRAQSEGEPRTAVELDMAALLLERLGRPLDALAALEPLLDASPGDSEVLRLVRAALSFEEARGRAAMLLEKVAESAETPEARAELIESLIDVSRGVPDLDEARGRWTRQLLEAKEDDAEAAIVIALRGAEEWPADGELWTAAERYARKLNRPEPVAEAYARVLEHDLSPDEAEELGRRMVEFHEEWFEDAERVVGLLERVIELCPGATWAFDRLKLAFNASARWPELFELYDRALAREADPGQQAELLREAAMAAKDFANDAERAIDYLERLDRLSPGDHRIESALERLYERESHVRPLIDLLSRRLEGAAAGPRRELLSRITSLWLDLGDAVEAYKLIKKLLEDKHAGEPVYGLLERLVALPGARESIAPNEESRKKRKDTRSVRHAAAELLRKRYEEAKRTADVARMLEVELELAEGKAERVERLARIIELKLGEIGDLEGAFESTAQLVALEPADLEHRKALGELAERTGAEARRAELLTTIADGSRDAAVRISLFAEAAGVKKMALDDAGGAIELHQRVLAEAVDDPASALAAARELDGLLDAAQKHANRCDVLERLAELETDPARRAIALGAAARVAGQKLGDWGRAIDAWRRRLDVDPGDAEALDGLADALAMAERWADLVVTLEQRAGRAEKPQDRRRDLEGVARLWADLLHEPGRAVEAWSRVRAEFGNDKDSYQALAELHAKLGNWAELAALTETEAAAESDVGRRRTLFATLGDLHARHTGDLDAALGAYVSAEQWERASEVAHGASDPAKGLSLVRQLLDRAVEVWNQHASPEEHVAAGAGWAAGWAQNELTQRLGDEGNHEGVLEALLRGATLPFPVARKRALQRDAALLASDRLADAKRATELFRELFAGDPADAVAQESVTRFAALLEEQKLDSEIAGLWEQQARGRAAAGDKAAAAALFARAAEIAEQRLGDVDRALTDHRAGAALGGVASLEALARLHESRGEPKEAAAVLEWLCAQSSRDELAPRALRLSEAYAKAGALEFARVRLEQAASIALDAGLLRQKLAELYRAQAAWAPLADLLAQDAERASDTKTRLRLLQEAAKIQLDRRNDPAAAGPLLERAIELAPDEPALRLLLADALTKSGRFDEATAALKRQIERYGTRKPKDRALVHFHLARVSLAAGRRAEAIAELDQANKIDPAHPGILQALAKLAFEEGQLERAEKQYRALLLVLGREQSDDAPSRAEALLDLSEIAARMDDAQRSAEFVESAFEAALESPGEAEALEKALSKRERYELLARAVEARLERASSAAEAARALSDLAFLHAERLGGLAGVEGRIRQRAQAIHADLEGESAGDDRAWAALGRVYDWLGDATAEADVLERRVSALVGAGTQIDTDPLYRLAEIRLADTAARDRGVEVLERALELGPDLPRAEALLRHALELDPDNERAAVLFERVARAENEPRTLASALEFVVRLPGRHIAHVREGVELATRLEDPALARRLLEIALRDGPESLPAEDAAWALLTLAGHRERDGELGACLDLSEQAAALLPPEESRRRLLDVATRATRDLGDHERAARLFEALRQQDPADREVWEPLCDVYRRLGSSARLVELIEATVPLVDQVADRARLRLEQASILLDENQTDDATTILREVLEEEPGQQRAADLLLGILERARQTDELVSLLVSQIDSAKDRQDAPSIVAHSLRLGHLLESLGRSDDAFDVFVAVLDWDRSNAEVLNAVIRLAELRDDSYVVADALESLLAVERGEHTVELVSRLVSLRSDQADEPGVQRALELGFVASPTTSELRDPLLERYAASEDWAGAARVLREAIKSVPGDRDLLGRLIDAHQRAGDTAAALEVLEGLPREMLEDPEVERARAMLLTELGRDEDALAVLESAYAKTPDCAPELCAALERAMTRAEPAEERRLLLRLVEILEQRGDVEGARARLGELVKLAPKDKDALKRLAELETRTERWDAASTVYRKLIALEEGEALCETALLLSDTCERGGRFGDARGGLERALAQVPGHTRVRERLRAAYEAVGDNRASARLVLEDAAAAQQVSARLGYLLRAGTLLLMPEGDPAEAVRVLEEARGLSPESSEGVVLLARAYAAVGRAEEGMQLLNEAVAAHRGRRSRELSSLHREISRLELAEGFLSEALASLTKAFEMDMKNARLAMELGQLALDLDETETAARAFRAVTMLRPGEDEGEDGVTTELRAHAQYQLALMAQRASDVRRARVLAQKALSENPEHELARQLLAELGAG